MSPRSTHLVLHVVFAGEDFAQLIIDDFRAFTFRMQCNSLSQSKYKYNTLQYVLLS